MRRQLHEMGIPLPENLVLALMQTESGGVAGNTNKKSGASGLLQVMPNTLKWYDKQTGDNVTLSDMRSTSGGESQIRVGLWVLWQFWKSAYRYLRKRLEDIPVIELAKVADLFYVAGPGGARGHLDKCSMPFFSYAEAKFPRWNALPHPRNVFRRLPSDTVWNLDAISTGLEGELQRSIKTRNNAGILIIATLAVYWLYLRKRKTTNAKKEE